LCFLQFRGNTHWIGSSKKFDHKCANRNLRGSEQL